jgi:hypothetical protein
MLEAMARIAPPQPNEAMARIAPRLVLQPNGKQMKKSAKRGRTGFSGEFSGEFSVGRAARRDVASQPAT